MENILLIFNESVNLFLLLSFLIGEGLIVILFIIFLLLGILDEKYDFNKTVAFSLISLSVTLYQAGVYIGGKWLVICVFSLALSLFFSVVLFLLGNSKRKKEKRIVDSEVDNDKIDNKDKQAELSEYINSLRRQRDIRNENDEKISPSNSVIKSNIERVVSSMKTKRVESEVQYKEPILDFSHVKNILKRLTEYSLTPSDKRQVKDLESMLLIAEKGEIDKELKERLNNSLGGLLKMMSKYGV